VIEVRKPGETDLMDFNVLKKIVTSTSAGFDICVRRSLLRGVHLGKLQNLKTKRTACGGKEHGSRRVLHGFGEGGVPWLQREACLKLALALAAPL